MANGKKRSTRVRTGFGTLRIPAIAAAALGALITVSACSRAPVPLQRVIGIINPNEGTHAISRGFVEGLKEYGYVDGENITIVECPCRQECNFDETLQDFKAKGVGLIFAVTTPAAKASKEFTKGTGIPVIFAVNDPVSSGLIESLPQPGGNLSGIQIRGSVSKALEWLLELAPGARNVFVPVKFDTGAANLSLEDLRKAAESPGITLTVVETNTEEELDAALSAIPDTCDAVFLLHSILISSNAQKIVDAAVQRKLPCGAASALYEHGVTISYGLDTFRAGKQASRLAAEVLRGEQPSRIPSEMADFFLGVNVRTAEQAGIRIPDDVLLQADFIVR